MSQDNQSQNIPIYAQGDFSKELNYKVWSTKGTRFCASTRYKKKNRNSIWTIGLLSAYLIIFNIADILIIQSDSNWIQFGSVGISLLVLVFSLFENLGAYGLKGHLFHQCGLELSKIYSELRISKTMNDGPVSIQKLKSINEEYDRILDKYENHDPIDYKMFKAQKPTYEDHNLSWFDVKLIHLEFFFKTHLVYFFMMICPIVLFVIYAANSID